MCVLNHNHFLKKCCIMFQSVDVAQSVLALRKANGEAAHLACVKILKVRYIILGSKVNTVSV